MKTKLWQKFKIASNTAGIQSQQGRWFFDSLMKQIADEFKENEVGGIKKYFTFKTKYFATKKGRNPNTGETIIIPAHKKVKATCGSFFKKIISLK